MAKRRSSSASDKTDTGGGEEPEQTQFMVKGKKETKEELDERKGMKTSEEIQIFSVGGAPVVDYVQDQKQEVIEYDDDPDVIEFDSDSIKRLDITTAKTVEIDGKSIRDDLGKELSADFKSLKQTKYDERKIHMDIKRNIEEYRPLCRSCRSTMKCKKCGGKGKVLLMLKCSDCGGSGMCAHCGEYKDVKCPSCAGKLSVYATQCRQCGAAFTCPSCYGPIPSSATRCMNCRTDFYCSRCKATVAPALDNKCVRCGTKKWFARPKRELPIRKEEKRKAM